MPSEGLDPSWKLATNVAVVEQMSIGTSFLFTSGPLSALYTELYHPKLDSLILLASSILVMAVLVLLSKLETGSVPWRSALFVVAISLSVYLRDSLFLTYPFLFAVYTVSVTHSEKMPSRIRDFIAAAPLGILPLVKGSFFLTALITTCLVVVYLLSKRRYSSAVQTFVTPIVVCLLMWLASGQTPNQFPEYFASVPQIISGYTEAMSLWGNWTEIFVFLAASSLILIAILKIGIHQSAENIILFLTCGLALFVSFKGGFVRHDGHAMIAASSLVIVSISTVFILPNKRAYTAAVVAFLGCFIIVSPYAATSPTAILERFSTSIDSNFNATISRIRNPQKLEQQYVERLTELRNTSPLKLEPSSLTYDVYAYDQAYLLANDINWNPRPVFQSYSAYNPELQRINAAHVASKNGPDKIFFKLQTIDNRLPALMDAASWVPIFENYDLKEVSLGYLMFNRSTSIKKIEEINSSFKETEINQWVDLPSDGIIKMVAHLEMSATGKLANLFFKPPTLYIKLRMRNGSMSKFRLVSGIAENGFIITPSIQTTNEFALLMSGYGDSLDEQQVAAFMIQTEGGGDIFWHSDYKLTLKELNGIQKQALPKGVRVPNSLPNFNKLPVRQQSCDGSVDVIDGENPGFTKQIELKTHRLDLAGWVVSSVANTLPADFIALRIETDNLGGVFWPARRFLRPDVAKHFSKPGLEDSGFSFNLDTSSFGKKFSISVAHIIDEHMTVCENLTYEITHSDL